jgi:histidinol dehydrogenase
MRILKGPAATKRVNELAKRASLLDAVEPKVRKIVTDVQQGGEKALLKYAREFDGLKPAQKIRVSEDEISKAWDTAPLSYRKALEHAARNIRQFCEWQKPSEWMRTGNGITVGQLVRPLNSVGCYVPGGRHPLPSTLLMTVIPAQVVGVREIRVVSPQPQPGTLAAAAMLGVSEFYRIGGAQAIAALAYGTESVPKVDKIVGPGNKYVTAAKKIVAFDCAIDMLAGPTEIVSVANKGMAPYIASDLVAQAEHDPDTLAVFITAGSPEFAKSVADEAMRMAENNEIAMKALKEHGVVLIAKNRAQAMEWANTIAPEHITVCREDLAAVRSAGSVFVGDYSPQAVGDYASGPNHVLPTGGAARGRAGLSVYDFVKLITMQELSREGLQRIAPVVTSLAETEGLRAHAESIRVRGAHA